MDKHITSDEGDDKDEDDVESDRYARVRDEGFRAGAKRALDQAIVAAAARGARGVVKDLQELMEDAENGIL